MLCVPRTLVLAVLTCCACPARAAEPGDCESAFADRLRSIRQSIAERRLVAARAELDSARAGLPGVSCPSAAQRLDLLEGQLLLDEGRLTEADELLRSFALPPRASQDLAADYLYTVGAVAYELGQYRRARRHYESLLELDRALASPRLVAADLYNVASTYVAAAAGEESREAAAARYLEALAAAEEAGTARGIPNLYVEAGKLVGGAEGRRYLERGRELAAAPEDRVTALGALAVERVGEDPVRAGKLIDQALAVARDALEKEGNPWPLLHLGADRMPVRWATLPREEAIADGLEVLRHIETMRRRQPDEALRAGFFSVWSEAHQWLAGRLLEDARDPADLELAFLVMERYRARALADSFHAEAFASLAEISASLAEEEALLAFQAAPWQDVYGRFGGGSWLLAVSRGGACAYRLPERGALERRIRLYLGLIAQRSDSEGEAAARLYEDLLSSALAELPAAVDQLVLVPDGDLHLLPFGLLRAAPDAPYLASRFQISTVPSATLWQRWRRHGPRESAAAALVLADPRPGGSPAAPLRTALGPLPFAAKEGRAVVERWGRPSRLLLGDEATEAYVKGEDLRRFGVVHFAAHAVVDEVHPERSAVLLAVAAGGDGELRVEEIAKLDLGGGIVVLSACRSASGNVLRGEGVMSLARAFLQAGAGTVVGALWPLDDREAHLFFDAFYYHLARGRSVQEAVQRSQEDLRDAGAPPAAWGGVVVVGDGARAAVPRWRSGWNLGLLAAGVLLLIVVTSWRRRATRA